MHLFIDIATGLFLFDFCVMIGSHFDRGRTMALAVLDAAISALLRRTIVPDRTI